MTRFRLRGLALMLMLATALVVAACGGGEETTATTEAAATTDAAATTEEAIGGGEAQCDEATFQKLAEEVGKAAGTEGTLSADSFKCDSGWAVAFVDVGTGDSAYTETAVFQAEGPMWALQNREMVCGDNSPIPDSLYQDACETN